ncbi:MAG: HAMP domain-containing protein, partial [Rhabdaerophilum sp.]
VGSLLVMIVVTGLAFVLTERLLRPLGKVAEATNALAGGSDQVDIPCRDRTDQIGQIARAVEGFAGAVAQQREQERINIIETQKMAARKAEMDALVQQFRHSVQETL